LRTAFDALKTFPEKLDGKRDDITAAQTAADTADQVQIDALATVDGETAKRESVLTAGNAYLDAHAGAEQCPLCESQENIAHLAETVKSTLAQLGALTTANTKKRLAHKALADAKGALQQVEADCGKAVTAFSNAQATHQWKAGIQLPATPVPNDTSALTTWLAANEATVTAWAGVEASWRGENLFRTQLKSAADRYEANAARVAEISALIPNLDLALAQCAEERQKFTDGIIGSIAKEVGKLYEKVHPGEGLDKIALVLDPGRRASLNLGATFEGHDAPPQAYYSQSHLDTLGLCIFLALAGRDNADRTFLILDDVLGSIAPHVERVIGMIYEVSAGFQHTIVTTHYRPWREKYRGGWLKPGQTCQFVKLTGWAIDDGIRIISSLPEVDRLWGLLADAPIDPQAICSKAGVILEAVLDYLTLKYECAVPRRHGAAFTLGDLLPAIGSKLRDALKVEMRDGITDPAAASKGAVRLTL
jgi:hypothetical protein